MLVFLLILVAIICSGLTVAKKGEFCSDYCSPKNTGTINAIFSILIFLSHAYNYVECRGVFDLPYKSFQSFMGQLVVVTYLLFSGYGIMESYKRKGFDYIKAMPKNRLFRLWYHFAIVVCIYAMISIFLRGCSYSPLHQLLALIGYTSYGNSNWYMFVTFAMYIIIIISFAIFKNRKIPPLLLTVALSAGLAGWLCYMGKGSHWYNTIICFPLGMIFSLIKPKFDKLMMKNDVLWHLFFALGFTGFAVFSSIRRWNFLCYQLFVVFFVITLLILLMKVNIKSSVLDFFSGHIFSFFILQRIPMIILKHFGLHKNIVFYVVVSFFATVFLAVVFDFLTEKLDSVVFRKKEKN